MTDISVNEFFTSLFNTVPEAIAVMDKRDRIVRVNAAFEHLFGYTSQEADGRLVDDLVAPPELAMEAASYTASVERGETFTIETRRRRKDGSLVDVSLICAPIVVHGEQVATYGIYRDITDRKAAEIQREYFARLFDNVPEAIVILDGEGRITSLNGEFERVFGYVACEARGRLIDDLIVPADLAGEGSAYTDAVNRGETFTLETRRCRKDGHLIEVSLICAPILVEGCQVAAYGIYRDITDRKAAEAKLFESNRKITDSIRYASLIQESVLPGREALQRFLPDHMVIHRPRDVVGGDFHSFFPDPEGFLLAVADCSGHGVPGAFMTMSARAVLEQVLARLGPEDPAALLGAVNRTMKAILRQTEGGRDLGALDNGLDMALLRVRPREKTFIFAGARLSLWLRPPAGELEELRGDPQSLGYRRSRPDHVFANHRRDLVPGMSCYLFTDGILDQSGGQKGYGLGTRRLRTLLDEVKDLPMIAQKARIETLLQGYQGANPQRDDITLLGFRLGPESGKE
jgi:PAS domain S-box-containing protein